MYYLTLNKKNKLRVTQKYNFAKSFYMDKKIIRSKGYFIANGNKYIIHQSMPIGRYSSFEKFQVSALDDKDPLSLLQDLVGVYNLLNQSKVADATVKLHNTLNGLERINQQEHHPMLWICTCFIIKEGADFSVYNEAEGRVAIEDWIAEGFDVRDFFDLARDFVNCFIQISRSDIAPTSEEVEKEQVEK